MSKYLKGFKGTNSQYIPCTFMCKTALYQYVNPVNNSHLWLNSHGCCNSKFIQ